MVGIPKDLFAEGGPFYKPQKKFGPEPTPTPDEPDLIDAAGHLPGLDAIFPTKKPEYQIPDEPDPEAGGGYSQNEQAGKKPRRQTVFRAFSSVHDALRGLAKLVGFKRTKRDEPPADLQQQIAELTEAMRQQLAEQGITLENEADLTPEVMSTRELAYAMRGLSFMSATAAAGERGMSAMRWLVKHALLGRDKKPLDFRRLMRWAKHAIRKWVDEHRDETGDQPGRYYYAACHMSSDEQKRLTVPQVAVLFVAAYELETKIDWDEVQHAGPHDDLDFRNVSDDTDKLIEPWEPEHRDDGGKFNG